MTVVAGASSGWGLLVRLPVAMNKCCKEVKCAPPVSGLNKINMSPA